ncbi:MAG: homocysteine biosynthesis protein [Actinobacteria bacterium]|nr:homocysteine biosynthesis protein [Actinomycetota bacterium]
MSFKKTVEEINEKIKRGQAVVVTAEEMVDIVKSEGVKEAARKVDVVTTGTFGPMCSSGAFINFGHTNPPLKFFEVYLNEVQAYGGIAAADVYIGATQPSEDRGIEYGGAHVIEDFVAGKPISISAYNKWPTDCYPNTELESLVNKETVNEAFLFNPRNAYQNYAAATNSSNKTLRTYMGILLPNYGNVTYSTSSQLSPLLKDPEYRTLGIGTRIFLGGTIGYIAWQGTQHNPQRKRDENGIPLGPAGTIALIGNLKEMSTRYIRAATYTGYGCSLFVGVGVPIPILDEDIAYKAGLSDEQIKTLILDYAVASNSRPVVKEVTYAELRSGWVEIKGKKVKTAPLTSYVRSREIAETLKNWIREKKFFLTEPVAPLPKDTVFKPFTPYRKGAE